MSEGGITYSFKELLVRIETKVDGLAHSLDSALTEVRGSIGTLNNRVMAVEGKLHEIDQYGSREMRDLRDRVVRIEAGDVTKEQVENAMKEREEVDRKKGGYKLQILAAVVGALVLLLAIVSTVNLLVGGHT